jgi:hypothetical protein
MQLPIHKIELRIFLKLSSLFIFSNALIKHSYYPNISSIVFSNYNLNNHTFSLESNFFFCDKVMKYSSVTSHLNYPSEFSCNSPSISSCGQHLARDYRLSIETEFKFNFSTALIIS